MKWGPTFKSSPAPADRTRRSWELRKWISGFHCHRESRLMRPHLRLFTGLDSASSAVAEPTATVSLGHLLRVVSHAQQSNRAWLKDFADDEIQVSADLYEVLEAYWNLRPSA